MTPEAKTEAFEEARPQLVGVAYRLLGSISEAEDVVQDTGLKWFSLEGELPDRPIAWMTTVCTNRCLDILRSAHRTKVDYVGPWIPDFLATETTADAEQNLEMASSLATAFMLMLERLTPRERAAYLLHDVFDMGYSEVSSSLGLTQANCRQLTNRARRMIAQENVRFVPEEDRQRELLEGFQSALETGSTTALASMLSADVDLRADSGGKVTALRHVLEGYEAVSDFVAGTLSGAWAGMPTSVESINGQLGLVIRQDGFVYAAITFGYGTDGDIRSIFILRNPEKLKALSETQMRVFDKGLLKFI